MNFLQLCQRAVVECGAGGGTVLTTTADQIGSLGRIVNWVGDAWNDVQTEHDDWDWMRSSNILGQGVSFQTVAGQASYPLGINPDFSGDFTSDFTAGNGATVGISPDSFGKWDRDTFRCFTTTTGFINEIFLDDVPFDTWRNSYMYGAMRMVQTRPVAIAVGPDQSLNLGPPPNGLYTITGDYWVAPSVMVNDTDVPVGLPTRFHMLIVYIAMLKYSQYEAAAEVQARAVREINKNMGALEALRLPQISFAGALA